MITIALFVVACGILAAVKTWALYAPGIGFGLEMSHAPKLQKTLLSICFGGGIGGLLGSAIAFAIGGAFFPSKFQPVNETSIVSFHQDISGQKFFYTEKTSDYFVPRVAPIERAEVIPTTGPPKLVVLEQKFQNPKAYFWAIGSQTQLYRFYIPEGNPDFKP
jgi:hypothetical protein